MRSNRTAGQPSLVLLGFKGRAAVPFHFNLKSYFVYPTDTNVEGSTAAFAHLHQSMLKKNVVGIGELLVRGYYSSKLVAIHAFPEEVEEIVNDRDDGSASGDSDGNPSVYLKVPPCWIVTQLPFENEVRDMLPDASLDEDFQVSPPTQQALEKIINEQLSDLDWGDFKNPYLERFWDYVESVALEEPMPNKDYSLLPVGHEKVEELQSHVKVLKATLPEESDTKLSGNKRGASNARLSADDATDWATQLRDGNLGRFTTQDIKLGLSKYGVTRGLSGKKKEELVLQLGDVIRAAAGS